MSNNAFHSPKSTADLRSCAARARKLALTAMDALTCTRLEQLARDYETEADTAEREDNAPHDSGVSPRYRN